MVACRSFAVLLSLVCLTAALPLLAASATLDAPAMVKAGAWIDVKATGPNPRTDRVSLLPVGAPDTAREMEGTALYRPPARFLAPEVAGDYELRYVSSEGVLVRRKITIAAVSASLQAPDTAPAGSRVAVTWTGPGNNFDRIVVAKTGAEKGESAVDVRPGALAVLAPDEVGDYELRYLTRGKKILATRKLAVTGVTATLEAPDSVPAGAAVPIKWTGPASSYDLLVLLKAGTPEGRDTGSSRQEVYVKTSPQQVLAPDEPGEYELRYITRQSKKTLARKKLVVTPVTATVEPPATAAAGATILVRWTGPNNRFDKIALVPVGTPDKSDQDGRDTAFTMYGNPAKVMVSEKPGEYEVRYLTFQTHTTLASAKLTVGAVSASLEPATAVAGTQFRPTWKGPGNRFDFIAIVPKGAPDHQPGRDFSYILPDKPLTLRAPMAAGAYEMRYITFQEHVLLARAPLEVTPAKEVPGRLKVTTKRKDKGGGPMGAVEIILDASGSMLQKMGGARRIDIAKRTLTALTGGTIPAGTPFALRVFGREEGCETHLDIPVRPLDAASVAAQIRALEAKPRAKTPIAASLEKVADDLKGISGERVVILITDGEETCGGQPLAAIESLKKGGVNVRVNIVGFAIADQKLKSKFELWSRSGNGDYFDARDAKGMSEALEQALDARFEVVDGAGQPVAEGKVGGEPVSLMPGTYAVRLKGATGGAGAPGGQSTTIRANETSSVAF